MESRSSRASGFRSIRWKLPVRVFIGGSMISGGSIHTWRMKGMSPQAPGVRLGQVRLDRHGDEADVAAGRHLPIDPRMVAGDVLANVAIEAADRGASIAPRYC